MKEPWRVGRKLGRTLYIGDTFVGTVDSKEIAERIVNAMNGEYSDIRNGALDEAIAMCDQVGTFDPGDVNFTALKCKTRIEGLKF